MLVLQGSYCNDGSASANYAGFGADDDSKIFQRKFPIIRETELANP